MVENAKVACINSNYDVLDHSADTSNMVELGSSAQKGDL